MVISTYSNILLSVKYDKYRRSCVCMGGQSGHLDCLKYLHETAKAPWNYLAVREAHENNHPECLQYLLDNNCPLPTGWRYEGGTVTHVLNTCSDTQRERERERDNERERNTTTQKTRKKL